MPLAVEPCCSGVSDASGNDLNDVWSYWNAAEQWSQADPNGGPPRRKERTGSSLDSANQRMTIFGGSNAGGVLNDTWVLHAPGVSGLACNAAQAVNPDVRAEGITERMGDVVLNCTGGTPTPAGKTIPEYTITYTLGTNITSRRLPEATDLSEALLTIDEPISRNAQSGSA